MKNHTVLRKVTIIVMTLIIVLVSTNVYATEGITKETERESELLRLTQDTREEIQQRICPSIDFLEYKRVYIKNMYTGKYLDVAGGASEDGTNIQQYEFNGTDSQKWAIFPQVDNEYAIASYIGRKNDNEFTKVLDINGGTDDEHANANLWDYNGSDAQKISICQTVSGTYVMFTKCSNYNKVVQLDGENCNNGGNINQYTWSSVTNQGWIIEPIDVDASFGIRYASRNVENAMSCFPDLREWGGDCANFVSQCMLSSGIHYRDDWKVYRKNGNYDVPKNVNQLDDSWELCQPNTSPWTSAKQFGKYWRTKVAYNVAKGQEILDNPSMVWGFNLSDGDVIQYGDYGLFGTIGDSRHTMYVTGRDSSSYLLTYHSNSMKDNNLLNVCRSNPDKYFAFYRML